MSDYVSLLEELEVLTRRGVLQARREQAVTFVVEVYSNGQWRKVRGPEGGPWRTRDRAQRIAESRERAERRESSTEGLPHRVTERQQRPAKAYDEEESR